MNQTGKLEKIWIKRAKRGPMDAVHEATLIENIGIESNANLKGRRQVTILSLEQWQEMEAELDTKLDPAARRANLLVSNTPLQHSRGRTLAVGETRILINGETRPCERMDEAFPGLQACMGKDWRGGIYGQVSQGGSIKPGDPVYWLPDEGE